MKLWSYLSLTCVFVTNERVVSFVEFETAADLRTAVEKLDGREFKGARVQCLVDVSFR